MGKVLDILKRREVAQPAPEKLIDHGEHPVPGRGKHASARDTANEGPPASGDNEEAPQGTSTAAPEEESIPYYEYPDGPTAPTARLARSTAPPSATPAVRYEPETDSGISVPESIGNDLVVWRQSQSDLAEQYRRLCQAMIPQLAAGQIQTLLLPALEDHPKAIVAVANLALALAENRPRPLLLIDAAPHSGRVAALFGLASSPGWAELLAGMPLKQVVQASGWPGLHVIAAGNRLACTGPALQGGQVAGLWPQLRQHYSMVLVHPPAWHSSTMPAVLAHYCDAVCLFIFNGQAGRQLEKACLDALQHEGIRFLGSILLAE